MRKKLLRRALAFVAILAMVASFSPAAHASTLTAATWVASSTSPSDTAVRYTWTLTTTTTGSISSITFTVPAGTAGASLTTANAFGIGAASTVVLSSGTVTYTVASPVSIVANTPILISIDGFTNTATPGTYTSNVATSVDTTPLTTAGLVFNPNTATATFTVQQALSVTSSSSTVNLEVNPTGTADQSGTATTLTIKTNASAGYTLQAAASTLTSTGGATIAPVSTGVGSPVATGSFITNRWGYAATSATSGSGAPVNGVLTMSGGLTTATNFVGYKTAPEVIATQTGPTNGDVFAFVNRAKIDITQAAGLYSSRIVYTVAATY